MGNLASCKLKKKKKKKKLKRLQKKNVEEVKRGITSFKILISTNSIEA